MSRCNHIALFDKARSQNLLDNGQNVKVLTMERYGACRRLRFAANLQWPPLVLKFSLWIFEKMKTFLGDIFDWMRSASYCGRKFDSDLYIAYGSNKRIRKVIDLSHK